MQKQPRFMPDVPVKSGAQAMILYLPALLTRCVMFVFNSQFHIITAQLAHDDARLVERLNCIFPGPSLAETPRFKEAQSVSSC